MTVRHADTLGKNFAQIAVVAREPFTVNGKRFDPPRGGLVLSASFWRRYGCALHCGGCCLAFTLDYLPWEWEQFCATYPAYASRGHERTVDVNGSARAVWTIANDLHAQTLHGHRFCQFVDAQNGACTIHEQNPYSCRVELVKLRTIGETGYIQKAPFGRAWNLTKIDGTRGDVLCTFDDFDEAQLLSNDIPVLQQLQRWASYMGIATYLPDVLDTIDALYAARRFVRAVIAEGDCER